MGGITQHSCSYCMRFCAVRFCAHSFCMDVNRTGKYWFREHFHEYKYFWKYSILALIPVSVHPEFLLLPYWRRKKTNTFKKILYYLHTKEWDNCWKENPRQSQHLRWAGDRSLGHSGKWRKGGCTPHIYFQGGSSGRSVDVASNGDSRGSLWHGYSQKSGSLG